MRDKTLSRLTEALNRAGITNSKTIRGGRRTIHSWISKGRLRLRQRPHSGWHVVNEKEITEIKEAFSPGGKGYWFFDE
jgi:predicted site-specific integrase-resolvase